MAEEPPIDAVYDRIAEHFSQTREYPWPEVTEFLADVSGEVGVDVGCGNGRHTEPLADRVDRAVGIDVSRELLHEARERAATREYRAEFLEADATELPIGADTVDVALYVAAIHHLRTREARIRSLDELARVLINDGRAIVSAWSTTHDKFDETVGFDTTVDWTLPDGTTIPRFYHIYDPAEFEADVRASDLVLGEAFLASGNCYAVVHGP